jgi:N-acetylmuramoyl-L-alanine amidase
VLDPGHGGPETGSVGANGLVERNLNLIVALLVEKELLSLGYTVALTRRTDLHMPIRQRTAIANSLSPKAFVSIHHNGGAQRRSDDPGTETFHQLNSSESKRLAGLLFEEVFESFKNYWVPWVKTVHNGASSRLSEPGRDAYGILRNTPDVPTAIVEAAYLSNPPEAEILLLPEVQQVEAEAITRAIHRFISTSDPGSGFKPSFIDGVMTGTGSARGCVDAKHGGDLQVTVAYNNEEFKSLTSAAKKADMSIEEFQLFGVHALDLFLKLDPNGNSLEEKIPTPTVSGSNVSNVNWSAESQVALARVGRAYGFTSSEVQKLGATLMVFLTGL